MRVWVSTPSLCYRLWAAATAGSSGAERTVAWRLAEQYNRMVNTYDNVGLANSYIWSLLLFAGTCLLCLASRRPGGTPRPSRQLSLVSSGLGLPCLAETVGDRLVLRIIETRASLCNVRVGKI